MSRRFLLPALMAVFVLATGLAIAAEPHSGLMRDDGIHMESWMEPDHHDLAKAAKTAADSGKTLLVIVEGPGCTACAAMHADHFQVPQYAAFMQKHFLVHLMSTQGTRQVTDATGQSMTERKFVQKSRVRGTPTLMFLNAKGQEFFRIPGLPDTIYFRAFMDYVADGSAAKELDLDKWWANNEAKVRARHNI